jgi:hypothetical protein
MAPFDTHCMMLATIVPTAYWDGWSGVEMFQFDGQRRTRKQP